MAELSFWFGVRVGERIVDVVLCATLVNRLEHGHDVQVKFTLV